MGEGGAGVGADAADADGGLDGEAEDPGEIVGHLRAVRGGGGGARDPRGRGGYVAVGVATIPVRLAIGLPPQLTEWGGVGSDSGHGNFIT